jgi:hypothetical protein
MTKQMSDLIAKLESARLLAKKKATITIAIGGSLSLVFLIMIFVGFLAFGPVGGLIFGILFIASAIVLAVGIIGVKSFKRKVIEGLTSQVNADLFPGAVFKPKDGLPLATIMRPGFFSEPDRYLCGDFMSATYEGIPFARAHYEFQKIETHSNGKTTYTTYNTYAKGTMYHFSYGRDFGQIVKVMEKQGILAFNTSGLKKVETEYIEFNRKFQILASDETMVFYLLTPQIQEKVMELEGKFKGHFFMAFMGHELFIAVDDSDSSISLSINKPITEDSMGTIIEILAIPSVFISLLGLNKAKFEKNAGTGEK